MNVSASASNPLTTAEQALLWRQLFQHTPGGIVGLEAVRDKQTGEIIDFQYRFINDQALRDTFRPQPDRQHDITGQLFSTYFPSIRQSPLWDLYQTVIGTQQAIQGGGAYLFDGHSLRVDMVVSPFGDGILVSYNEISVHHHNLEAIERQAQLLDGLLNTVQNGISVLEAIRDEAGRLTDFRFVETSQALLDGLGLTREQVRNNRILSILPGLRDTTIWPIYMRVLETGVPHKFEHHYKADGYDRYFDLSVVRLNDGLVVSYNNIGEAKLVQHQLETLVIELRRSNESLHQFAYVASHDLQEPLRKIVSFGDVLQQQYATELSAPAADFVRRMQNAAGRMRILVQDLLTYSRLTGHPARYGPVPLDQVVAEVVADFGDSISEARTELTVAPLPTVRGDSRLLFQLMQNLISNALKFHRPDQPPRITITGQLVSYPDALPATNRCAEISIRDEGIGFDEKYLDRIFTVFQRLHGQQQYAGTGIGLAICQKVVELHSGAITAHSQPGAGATFTVWLPIP